MTLFTIVTALSLLLLLLLLLILSLLSLLPQSLLFDKAASVLWIVVGACVTIGIVVVAIGDAIGGGGMAANKGLVVNGTTGSDALCVTEQEEEEERRVFVVDVFTSKTFAGANSRGAVTWCVAAIALCGSHSAMFTSSFT